MRKISADAIIKTYTTLANERGGVPIGERFFTRRSGISRYNWMGGYWRSWSAFQEAAGYSPNDATQKIPDEVLLRRFAELALERGSIPTEADLNLKRKADPSFPGKLVFRRWGGRDALLEAAIAFCEAHSELAPALEILTAGTARRLGHRLASLNVHGFVYLIRSGKNFKIGRQEAPIPVERHVRDADGGILLIFRQASHTSRLRLRNYSPVTIVFRVSVWDG
jgi:hypothetical protein